jgi:hypothetical protein
MKKEKEVSLMNPEITTQPETVGQTENNGTDINHETSDRRVEPSKIDAAIAAVIAANGNAEATSKEVVVPGSHVKYLWQDGSEHTGVVRAVGHKWIQIINDKVGDRKDGGLDWIEISRNVVSVISETVTQ